MIISKKQAKQLVYEENAKLIPDAIIHENGKRYQVIKRIDIRRQDCFLIDEEPESTFPESSQGVNLLVWGPDKAPDLTLEEKRIVEEHEELRTNYTKAITQRILNHFGIDDNVEMGVEPK